MAFLGGWRAKMKRELKVGRVVENRSCSARGKGRWLMALLLLAMGLMACSGGGPSTDSETHWMQTCTSDADCGADLSCICEVCTVECDGDCSAVGEIASCGEAPDWCDDASGELCLIECDDADDCDSGVSCDGGLCVSDGGFDIGEPECQEEYPFYCEGADCCPGECYSLSDSLIDIDEACRLEEGEAHYCISPEVLAEEELQMSGEAEDCYVDSARGMAFVLPTQTPGMPTGGESPLQSCGSEIEDVIYGPQLPECDDQEQQEPFEIEPTDEHRQCVEHDECVWIYADCGRSCACDAVHEDYQQMYDDMLDDCPDCCFGECDYECRGENFQEVSRCEDGMCVRFRSGAEEFWIDRVDLDDDYTIGVAAYLDEDSGLNEEETSFSLESLVDDSRLYYDDAAEREEFDGLPETHLYAESRDLTFDNGLVGRLFYEEDQAVAVIGKDGEYREVVFVQGDIVGWANMAALRVLVQTIEEK